MPVTRRQQKATQTRKTNDDNKLTNNFMSTCLISLPPSRSLSGLCQAVPKKLCRKSAHGVGAVAGVGAGVGSWVYSDITHSAGVGADGTRVGAGACALGKRLGRGGGVRFSPPARPNRLPKTNAVLQLPQLQTSAKRGKTKHAMPPHGPR